MFIDQYIEVVAIIFFLIYKLLIVCMHITPRIATKTKIQRRQLTLFFFTQIRREEDGEV